jgi:hypothetical protein
MTLKDTPSPKERSSPLTSHLAGKGELTQIYLGFVLLSL